MKRFQFPLETVRRWRLERVGIEELMLRQILAEKQKLAATKAQIQRELAQALQQVIGQSSMQPLELESLDSFRLYVGGRSVIWRVKNGNAKPRSSSNGINCWKPAASLNCWSGCGKRP
jgi:hypothetical protein